MDGEADDAHIAAVARHRVAWCDCGLPIRAPRVGVKMSAETSEADSVAISVIGMYFMNWPTMPGQKRSGEKAAMRVSVAAITGPDMRLAASA